MSRPTIPTQRLQRAEQTPASPEAARLARAERAIGASTAQSRPPEKRGLPAWLTSPKVISFGIILAALVISEMQVGLFHWRRESGKQQLVDSNCLVLPKRTSAGASPHEQPAGKWRLASAPDWRVVSQSMQRCPAGECNAENRRYLVRNIEEYARFRIWTMEQAYDDAGAAVLAQANDQFKTNADFNIVFGVRDMIAEDALDLSLIGAREATFLQLVIKQANHDLPVCFSK
jgi:hypothetical protein